MKHSYLILFTPRTGSSLLCHALIQTQAVGEPREYFQLKLVPAHHARNYVLDIVERASTPGGVFGAKLTINHLDSLDEKLKNDEVGTEALEGRDLIGLLSTESPPLLIWLRRKDTLRQAVSYFRAQVTGEWCRRRGDPCPPPPAFDREAIVLLQRRIIHEENRLAEHFLSRRLLPLTMYYEDFINAYERTTSSLVQVISGRQQPSFPVARTRSLLLPQADSITEDWLALLSGSGVKTPKRPPDFLHLSLCGS
jgi:trehalose 2-sulfotransferase